MLKRPQWPPPLTCLRVSACLWIITAEARGHGHCYASPGSDVAVFPRDMRFTCFTRFLRLLLCTVSSPMRLSKLMSSSALSRPNVRNGFSSIVYAREEGRGWHTERAEAHGKPMPQRHKVVQTSKHNDPQVLQVEPPAAPRPPLTRPDACGHLVPIYGGIKLPPPPRTFGGGGGGLVWSGLGLAWAMSRIRSQSDAAGQQDLSGHSPTAPPLPNPSRLLDGLLLKPRAPAYMTRT